MYSKINIYKKQTEKSNTQFETIKEKFKNAVQIHEHNKILLDLWSFLPPPYGLQFSIFEGILSLELEETMAKKKVLADFKQLPQEEIEELVAFAYYLYNEMGIRPFNNIAECMKKYELVKYVQSKFVDISEVDNWGPMLAAMRKIGVLNNLLNNIHRFGHATLKGWARCNIGTEKRFVRVNPLNLEDDTINITFLTNVSLFPFYKKLINQFKHLSFEYQQIFEQSQDLLDLTSTNQFKIKKTIIPELTF